MNINKINSRVGIKTTKSLGIVVRHSFKRKLGQDYSRTCSFRQKI